MGYIENPSDKLKDKAKRPFNASFALNFRNGQKFTLTGVALRQEENKNDKDNPFIFWVITTSLGERFDITVGILADKNRYIADTKANQSNPETKDLINYPLRDLQQKVKGSLSEMAAKLAEKNDDVETIFNEIVKKLKNKEIKVANYRPIQSVNSFDATQAVKPKMICDLMISA